MVLPNIFDLICDLSILLNTFVNTAFQFHIILQFNPASIHNAREITSIVIYLTLLVKIFLGQYSHLAMKQRLHQIHLKQHNLVSLHCDHDNKTYIYLLVRYLSHIIQIRDFYYNKKEK